MSCDDDDDNNTTTEESITIAISGLEDLGEDFVYEGWLLVGGTPVSAGTFTVDSTGALSKTTFENTIENINDATAYIVTIEPAQDTDTLPTSTHILAGDFSNDVATLTVGHSAALGNDFTSATGGYILATPTDGNTDTNEESGIWWLDPNAGPAATLTLPTLPEGWNYEGWVVIDGIPVTTGTFKTNAGADDSAPYSSMTADGPPFPGEDFLENAPDGITFPVDLKGKTAVISVEPSPDNSAAPFTLKPLLGPIAADAAVRTVYDMNNNAAGSNPTGTVMR
ncbi:hypothetical protein GCM10025777_18460 [Membranihabitans marinus]